MTNTAQLCAGLEYEETMTVESRHTVPHVGQWPGFNDMPPVFATAMMIGFVEQTCIQALRPYMDQGAGTGGTHVNISHSAPTPVGGVITAKVHLTDVSRKKLTFLVAVSDDHGPIGEGTHERAIIDLGRFEAGVAKRMTQA